MEIVDTAAAEFPFPDVGFSGNRKQASVGRSPVNGYTLPPMYHILTTKVVVL